MGWSESAWAAPAGCQLVQLTAADAVAAVKSALLDGYLDGARQLTTADVLRRVRSIRPTSEVKREARTSLICAVGLKSTVSLSVQPVRAGLLRLNSRRDLDDRAGGVGQSVGGADRNH